MRANPEVYKGATDRFRARIKATDPERWEAILKRQNENVKAWTKTDKGRIKGRLDRHRRRARLRALLSSGVSRQQWEAICLAQSNEAGEVCCKYCKRPCQPTVEHVVPIARGGRDEASNVVAACGSCNSSKQDHLITEWPRAAALLDEHELDALATHTVMHLG